MKTRIPTYLLIVFSLIALVTAVGGALMLPSLTAADTTQPSAPAATPVGTGFTYQGYLANNNSAANGLHDFEFKLFDANAGGAQIGSTVTLSNVQVQNGLFVVELDFGALAFGQNARWLEIRVRPSGGGAFTALSPRQELRPAPYALGLPNVYTDESQNFVGIGRNFRISSNEVP